MKTRYIVTLESKGATDPDAAFRSLKAFLKRAGRFLMLRCIDIKVQDAETKTESPAL